MYSLLTKYYDCLLKMSILSSSSSSSSSVDVININIEFISDTMWPNGVIGKQSILRQVESLNKRSSNSNSSSNSSSSISGRKMIQVHMHRVAFFLEPAYLSQSSDFSETHTARMLRKFGSKEAFERVKVQQVNKLINNYVVIIFIFTSHFK